MIKYDDIKKLLFIFLLAFGTNWVWENAHAILYYHPDGTLMTQEVLLLATLFDATFIAFLGIIHLITPGFRGKLWLLLIVAFVVAVVIEWRALIEGRWAYTFAMPIIPLLDTGLTPTLQLPLLTYLVFRFAKL